MLDFEASDSNLIQDSLTIMPTPVFKRLKPAHWIAFLLVGIGAGAFVFMTFRDREEKASADGVVRGVVDSEEVILELTPKLQRLSRSLMNLSFPDLQTDGGLFSDQILVLDLSSSPQEVTPLTGQETVGKGHYGTTKGSANVSREELSLWRPLLDQVDYFEQTSMKLVKGSFKEGSSNEFEGSVYFSGLARAKSGEWLGLSGKQKVTWQKTEDEWLINSWKMQSMTATKVSQRLFTDQLDEALPDPGDRHQARHSIHQEELVKYYHSGKTRARSHDFAPIAMNQKPALSIVDFDNDGFDDIYIMVRMGQNLLLHNQGDGTFKEVAADQELAIEGNSTCGIFADFDNDGDPDLILGRSLEPSLYFENDGFWFKRVEDPWTKDLPSLASSISAADFNNDGLLDFYICTYRPEALGDSNPGLVGNGGSGNTGLSWPDRFLNEEDAKEYMRLHRETDHNFLDQVGPPNSLWINRGNGSFEIAEANKQTGIWENSLQATWVDYDEDGDPDLYIANDFAPDCFFRNDREKGFVEVADEVGANVYGFGMGASFGDYDGDGQQDLYVSNMFSKAGRRILSQFDGIGENYVKSVQGNVLYQRTQDGAFEHVSGLEPPALLVAKAGWSWGGQFADFDNDSDLDLYALSGYFTAPDEVASEIDL